jgi:hypothetical protein
VARLWLLAVVFLTACATPNAESPATQSAKAFASGIASIQNSDPHSPAELSLRLSYVEFLLSTDAGPCQQRIESAQQQLDQVEANPETGVMFPDGWSRTVGIEYQLHLARADCLGDPGRAEELRAAVAAARRAADISAEEFDYPTAAIMQFNAAVLLHQLGDTSAAITTLESTLAMDKEFGFQDDARDNYKLLLTWQGKSSDDAQVTAFMQDFPKRKAILRFAWRPQQAHVSLEDRRDCLWASVVRHSHAAASYERLITGDPNGGWNVSYTPALTPYEPGVWPTLDDPQAAKMVFAPADVVRLNFKVSAAGAFAATTNAPAAAAQFLSETNDLIRAQAPAGNDTPELTKVALDTAAITLSSGLLVAKAAENFQIETSMWAGATLDQGVWYQMTAPLSLRGLTRIVVQQRLDFAFTRMVPCTAGTHERTCVELVVRTTPDQQVVDGLITSYTASAATRIVMDPATLLSYSREDRLYWYASIGKEDRQMSLGSERFKSTTTYGGSAN